MVVVCSSDCGHLPPARPRAGGEEDRPGPSREGLVRDIYPQGLGHRALPVSFTQDIRGAAGRAWWRVRGSLETSRGNCTESLPNFTLAPKPVVEETWGQCLPRAMAPGPSVCSHPFSEPAPVHFTLSICSLVLDHRGPSSLADMHRAHRAPSHDAPRL